VHDVDIMSSISLRLDRLLVPGAALKRSFINYEFYFRCLFIQTVFCSSLSYWFSFYYTSCLSSYFVRFAAEGMG